MSNIVQNYGHIGRNDICDRPPLSKQCHYGVLLFTYASPHQERAMKLDEVTGRIVDEIRPRGICCVAAVFKCEPNDIVLVDSSFADSRFLRRDLVQSNTEVLGQYVTQKFWANVSNHGIPLKNGPF
ncbi:hypothetical protein PROFUN_16171 [Planoprotostelium fungivorum]|uniref:Uncharacterized protein n=1 Tax=Planoprotostelium fungivorum TaxID=1890364 RepID=A0A2P6MSA1_9EUKA|nr:hypothetical protein PROFUN_16171 [Planoprotostelium fungivorum]